MKSYELGSGIRHTVNDYTNFNPNDNVKIYVRAKPLAIVEEEDGEEEEQVPQAQVLKTDPDTDNVLILRNPDSTRIVEDKFAFDSVFRGDTTQEELFDNMAMPVIDKVLDGYNGCIFAYGQTGSGKTYTMFGEQSAELAGVIPRTAEYIFRRLDHSEHEIAVGCSIVEIYNERIRDIGHLFAAIAPESATAGTSPGSAPKSLGSSFAAARKGMVPESTSLTDLQEKYRKMDLSVMQGKNGEVVIKNVVILKVHNTAEVLNMVDYGLRLRETHGTSMNATSSRSHTVFTMRIIQRNRANGSAISSVLNLIDLAGSERMDDSNNTGQRLKEEIFINSSLTVLGKVIMALDPSLKKKAHVPYRESKLTRILQNSLSGNSYVSVLANISPHPDWYFECLSTMEFVSRCRNVHNDPRINYYDSSADALNDWAGLGNFAAPEPEQFLDFLEPEHRLIASGSKVYWRANAAMDFYLFEHIGRDVVELIGYNTGLFLEFDHIFLVKSALYRLIAKGANKRLARQTLQREESAAAKHHLLSKDPKTGGGSAPHYQTHILPRSSSKHEGHDQGHSRDSSETESLHSEVDLVEIMDLMAGEYAINHMVYINGIGDSPPSIKFVDDIHDLDANAPLMAAKPEDCRPITRPLSNRDKELLAAQDNGETLEDIIRLKRQANAYLTRAADLLGFDLDAAAERSRHHKLLGMMDHEEVGGEAEDPDWVIPTRHIKPVASPASSDKHHSSSVGHLPGISPRSHTDGNGHNVHDSAKMSSSTTGQHPSHKHVSDASDHLPSINHVSGSILTSQKLLATSESGTLHDDYSLLIIFKSYASDKYHHNELDVFEFKKMCRELHLTTGKFTTGSAEGAFRKTMATLHTEQGDTVTDRITFELFHSLLRNVAHDRACLYDQVVNIMVNSFEQHRNVEHTAAVVN